MTLEFSKFLTRYAEPLDLLLVEDNPEILNLLQNCLTHFDVRVTVATSKAQAADLMQGRSFDGLLVDLKLPDTQKETDLLEVIAKHFSSRQTYVPLAILSGHITPDVEHWVCQLPPKSIVVMVPKPYHVSRSMLAEVLNQLKLPWRYAQPSPEDPHLQPA